MSNYSKMYWLTRLDAINGALIFLIVISVLALIFYYISNAIGDEEPDDFAKRYAWIRKTSYLLIIIPLLMVTFIPSKNDMIFIFAGGKTMNFVESDTSINKLPAQTTKIISNYLDKVIKENNKEEK